MGGGEGVCGSPALCIYIYIYTHIYIYMYIYACYKPYSTVTGSRPYPRFSS